MKFSRILGAAAAVLVTTAVAQQAGTPASPSTTAAPAPAATVMPAAEPAAAPVTALDAKPATAGDPAAGQTKAGACAACHGLDGNSADPQYPKLAGQHERYIARMLHLFKGGERMQPIMMGMAAPLSEQDMRDIGAYFATQHALPGVADDTVIKDGPNAGKKFYEVGEKLFRAGNAATGVPACMACHGPSGRGNPGPAYPSLAGQHAGYTAARLQAFRGGEVWGKGDNANPTMMQIAHNLTDEEIQSLASYIEGLHNSADNAPVAAK